MLDEVVSDHSSGAIRTYLSLQRFADCYNAALDLAVALTY